MTSARTRAAPIQVPSTISSRDGIRIDTSDDRWIVWDLSNGRFSLAFHSDELLPHLRPGMKSTLAWFARNHSAGHLRSLHYALLSALRHAFISRGRPATAFTAELLANYRSDLLPEEEWRIGNLRPALEKWRALGHEGVDRSALEFLKSTRFKHNPRGVAVLTMDPISGPFTDNELEAIQGAVTDAYTFGHIDARSYLLISLFMLLGPRPVQVAALKACDVTATSAADGTRSYLLRVPRAKQRGQQLRQSFKLRPVIPQIGELLAAYASRVAQRFSAILPVPETAPLFPAPHPDPLAPDGFEWHTPALTLASQAQQALADIAPTSERTGQPVHIAMTRFRRTLGTRAAMEGHSALVIAELLDHTETSNVRVYVEARPEIAERIDRAIAFQIAPLARAFAGEIQAFDSSANSIRDPRFDPTMKRGVGGCGSKATCDFAAPIACYTCASFHPWVDGPHEAVLDHLLAERAQLMESCDARVASVNDRTLFAVAEVVLLCRKRSAKEAARG